MEYNDYMGVINLNVKKEYYGSDVDFAIEKMRKEIDYESCENIKIRKIDIQEKCGLSCLYKYLIECNVEISEKIKSDSREKALLHMLRRLTFLKMKFPNSKTNEVDAYCLE